MRNIIWIIVDSVRNYACPADRVDDRGRIKLMDELSKDWIDFKNVVTSAPSTIMSISAMFTSTPSYYLGSNFTDFKLDESKLPTIGSILRKHGYHTYFNTLLANEREAWDSILDHIPKKYWAKGLTHRNEWSNEKITETIRNLANAGLKEPFFLYVHYNVRGDENISENVGNGIKALEETGHFENTVVFLTSDHGYPDPFRKEEVKRMGKLASYEHRQLPHDLVLTDDNILVPLLLRYPGHKPKIIEQQVSTLDYLPTTLDLAGIKEYPKMHGISLVPLLNGEEMPELEKRKIRIDGRFLGQKGRCSALRTSTRKYIYYHDLPVDEREQFYDLTKDPLEIHNLIKADDLNEEYRKEIEEFREAFQREEVYGLNLQRSAMKEKYLQQLRKFFSKGLKEKNIKILSILPDAPTFNKLFIDLLKEIHGNENVDTVTISQERPTRRYDLVYGIIIENTGNGKLADYMSTIKATKKFYVDLNLNFARYFKQYAISLFTIDWKIRKKYYMREPRYLADRVLGSLKRIAK